MRQRQLAPFGPTVNINTILLHYTAEMLSMSQSFSPGRSSLLDANHESRRGCCFHHCWTCGRGFHLSSKVWSPSKTCSHLAVQCPWSVMLVHRSDLVAFTVFGVQAASSVVRNTVQYCTNLQSLAQDHKVMESCDEMITSQTPISSVYRVEPQ